MAELADALDLGSSGRPCGFESHYPYHVGASFVSLAPTFFKSQSALTSLLLLSKSNPLRWVSIWLLNAIHAALLIIFRTSYELALYRLLRLFIFDIAHKSKRRSSAGGSSFSYFPMRISPTMHTTMPMICRREITSLYTSTPTTSRITAKAILATSDAALIFHPTR